MIKRSIPFKSLAVAEERGNHSISRYNTNQIASFQPHEKKSAVYPEFLNTLAKIRMTITLKYVHGTIVISQ